MNVAFISDIHSNLCAFESVLADIRKNKIERIYCLGDIVGYHSRPNEVCMLMLAYKIISIKGNHDRDITSDNFEDQTGAFDIKRWTYNQLTPDHRDYLLSLPDDLDLIINGHSLKLVHGSLFSPEEYLYENSEAAGKSAAALSADILLCGHTHLPYFKFYGQKVIVNTGSVGKPKIGRPNATYITATLKQNSKPVFHIEEVSYDFEKAAAEVETFGLPHKFADSLRTGLA